MFEAIAAEADRKFNTGGKAKDLLNGILALMTDETGGGINGFWDRFRNVGLGDLIDSWIGTGANTPISKEQTESAIGEDSLNALANRAGLDYDTTVAATAEMLPRVVDELTPNGTIPTAADVITRIGSLSAATAAAPPVAGIFDRVDASAEMRGIDSGNVTTTGVPGIFDVNEDADNSILKWLLPLIILLILIVLGFWFCGGKSEPVAVVKPAANQPVANTNTAVVVKTDASAKATEPAFKIEAKNGKYFVTGIAPDQATADKIKAALTAQFGAENVDFSGLKVDANAKAFAANWWTDFEKLLPNLKGWTNGSLSFVGNRVEAANELPAAALAQLKTLFSGFAMPVSVVGETGATKQANDEALNELQNAGSVEEVIKALNVSVINFATGSADIPAENKVILEKAATVLKKQSEGTAIEIGGYTDNQGNAATNKTLSQSRADAVKKALVDLGVKESTLKAAGYGDADPVGDNATAEGRFANRRIAYKTASGNAPAMTTETKTTNGNTNAAK